MKEKYKRKTEDLWAVMYNYGFGDGLEVLCYESSYDEAVQTKKLYIENEHICPIIRKKRCKISERIG